MKHQKNDLTRGSNQFFHGLLIFALMGMSLAVLASGAFGGIGKAEAASASPVALAQAECTGEQVAVGTGDTLNSIANRCGVSVTALLRANPDITGNLALTPGTELWLPGATLQENGQQIYIVATGDTLSGIAARFNVTQSALLAVNPGIVDPSIIYVGQRIVLPESGAVIPDTGGQDFYTVQQGDTLYAIAARYGTTVDALLRANPQIDDPRLLTVGQKIALPGAVIIPNTGAETYIVQSGDTLSGIAVRFNTTILDLLADNPDISDPALIFPGQRISLPGAAVIPETGAGQDVYVVQSGDTLSSIAVRFNTTQSALLAANPAITDPSQIYAGQRIVLPESAEVIPDTGAGQNIYVIRQGDTLSGIAVQFGITLDDLLAANPGISTPNLIFPGQQIAIP